MYSQFTSEQLNPRYEEFLRLHKCWAWLVALGVVLMAVGAMAIGSSFVSTMTTIFVFGILLMAGGAVQVVNAFLARSWRGFFLYLASGALHFIVGELMIEHSDMAAKVLTLLLAVAFLVGGGILLVYALLEQFPGRVWVLLNGMITFFLGVSIWRQWPESSLWVIGLFIGIDLVFSGWSWVMLGVAVKRLGASAQAPPATAPPPRAAAAH
jgi:uncharacterized membrane protein HdeD (DUF308 family)